MKKLFLILMFSTSYYLSIAQDNITNNRDTLFKSIIDHTGVGLSLESHYVHNFNIIKSDNIFIFTPSNTQSLFGRNATNSSIFVLNNKVIAKRYYFNVIFPESKYLGTLGKPFDLNKLIGNITEMAWDKDDYVIAVQLHEVTPGNYNYNYVTVLKMTNLSDKQIDFIQDYKLGNGQ